MNKSIHYNHDDKSVIIILYQDTIIVPFNEHIIVNDNTLRELLPLDKYELLLNIEPNNYVEMYYSESKYTFIQFHKHIKDGIIYYSISFEIDYDYYIKDYDVVFTGAPGKRHNNIILPIKDLTFGNHRLHELLGFTLNPDYENVRAEANDHYVTITSLYYPGIKFMMYQDNVGIDNVGIDNVGIDNVGIDNVGIDDVGIDNVSICNVKLDIYNKLLKLQNNKFMYIDRDGFRHILTCYPTHKSCLLHYNALVTQEKLYIDLININIKLFNYDAWRKNIFFRIIEMGKQDKMLQPIYNKLIRYKKYIN